MLSRVTTRLVHSAKNRFFVGTAPSKCRTIFSGTLNQQNYESKPIASPAIHPAFQNDNTYEGEIADETRKIFLQFPHNYESKPIASATVPPTFQSDNASEAIKNTVNQKNYEYEPIAGPTLPAAFQSDNASEAIKIAIEQKVYHNYKDIINNLTLHEEEIAGQIEKVFAQFSHWEPITTQTKTWMTVADFRAFNVWKLLKMQMNLRDIDYWKAQELIEQQVKMESSYQVPKFLLENSSECSICSLDSLVCSKRFRSLCDNDNSVDAKCCLSPILLQLLRDVVSQLVVLHSWGITHGDINPNNISILKGQRLFAKLVNFGKSLEQSETPRADLSNLGHLIGFCISEGTYPFGDILAQPHKDLLEKIKLKRRKYLPEAFHLICNLLMAPQDSRLEAFDVLYHPLFWSPKKRVSFLHSIYVRLKSENRQREYPSVSRYTGLDISCYVMDETWAEEIGSVRLSCTSYEVLLRSLQWVRDMNVHYEAERPFPSQPPEEFEPFNDTEAWLYRIVDDYYSRHYPWLLIYLYAAACQSSQRFHYKF